MAKIKSELEKCNKKKNSNRLSKLTVKRNNKIKDYVHKCTYGLVERLKQDNVCKVVIGKNDQWKTDINIGKRNNQNFVSIPHAQAIQILKYKLELSGIEVILREESYTSKCSALDLEKISKHEVYLGSRIKRGLFRSSKGLEYNADINGAANIMRKEIPIAFDMACRVSGENRADGIEGLVVNPIKLKIKFYLN